ncbi:MAG: homocysteine S-methyltransferase family protein, partial [Planctomycetes bacterium]|nr:homocysteine S-methyltransferase family protein [Planctomycetota bacterium]
VLDGAMGTTLQDLHLPFSDYDGCENCSEVLVLTRPDVIGHVHRSFLAVGCDAVLTNTFGANQVVLAEFGLIDRTREINRRAATIAREACDEFATPARPRFVIGSVGPGTRLPTLGQVTWDELLGSYHEQVRGLLEGGVDAVLIETCQDILQAKCAVVAASDAMNVVGIAVSIFCTVTIESTGTMLVGTDIAAASVTLEAYPQVVGIGINCATGPERMSEHVHYLGAHCDRLLIVQPNAGLPQLVDGKPHYPLTPEEFARWLVEFVEVDGVNIVGGCCGTTPEHLATVVDALESRPPRARRVKSAPAVSSVYQAVPLRQDASCLTIGERTNANGSKQFRELLAGDDVDGMVQMARGQVNDGCHLLDVCTACVGRDEVRDMAEVVKRFATDVSAPLVIDSTDVRVTEVALKLAGGKGVINSVNLADGEDKAIAVCRLARRYGSALIALLIDEEGMAKTCARKVEVARRIYDLAVHRQGLQPTDLLIDPLTFTICTGQEDDRRLALETLEALKLIKEACPGVHTLLGVSNVSYGLKPPARRVLNSVFLHHARERGLDAAIVHASGVLPLFKIDGRHRGLAKDLIFARQRPGYDPLQSFLRDFEDVAIVSDREAEPNKSVEERLKLRIINGERHGLIEDLDEAMLTHRPLAIVNDILLDGMKTVGDLFGAGQTQLPFVLQSAETMRAAVEYLEPSLDQAETANKGTVILATVRGDVHDIGKNLVDI